MILPVRIDLGRVLSRFLLSAFALSLPCFVHAGSEIDVPVFFVSRSFDQAPEPGARPEAVERATTARLAVR
ncbi:MAG: hypothetical protein AAF488_18665, partial [Planctomycetota bacterium]